MTITVKSKPSARIDRQARVGALLCCLVLAGCGTGVHESAPVNPEVARETLTRAMESWKEGETLEALQEENPAIVVQDFDWAGGMKLLKYEVLGPGKEESANLVAQVKLTLADASGTQSNKTVTYVVGTAPALTVFRDMMR
jgi:hypothetical protein